MYELYISKCCKEQREPVDIAYYRMVFNKEFNIGFYRQRKDLCDKCFTFQHSNAEEKEKQKEEYEKHIKRKVTARRHRDEAKILAQSGDIHFVEYDLEAICNCPSSSSKLIYYKRRIAIYNFTMLDFDTEKRNVFCYCWHEGIGKKGAVEIGSCLLKYLKTKADGKPIVFMSDTCASQCRNVYISALLLYCVEAFNIPEINQKYFEPGHSQMEADNIHATIELAKKNIPLFHPSGFYTIIRKASRKNPYDVHEMGTEDFVDIKYLKTILVKNAKVDSDGNAVNWLKIRWLQYRKEDNKHIYFKYDLEDDDFKMIKIIRRGKRLPVEQIVLKNAYDKPLPISSEKYDDLQDLCRQGIIPTQYHDFYKGFSVGTPTTDDEDN
ncbi:uncharacterized protein LOC125075686 [Vanessa atalanta]|uniref:uncharacterized protein LOC125075686 n=1 Tax=Vanessa atalanta TaxID=42275 RepID=UPI001FCE29A8|nr:uncharacterized protein LOC125075686 [Vanessa atalanta]